MLFCERTLPESKRVALVAHDNRKQDLLNWAQTNSTLLANHQLFATGTSGQLIEGSLGIPVHKYLSGPLGGDQQIGASIAEGNIDALIFFWDPFEPMPHDPDVKALLRVAAVWNIPVACNRATADMLIHSPEFAKAYDTLVPDYDQYLLSRTETSADSRS